MAPDQGPQDQGQQQYQPQYPPNYPPQGQYPPPSGAPQPPHGYGPQPPRRDEKADEKQNEKEQEKKQEKGQGMDEKYRRNPLGFVTFALLVIWLGVTLLLQNSGVIPNDRQGWAIFMWGGGALILVEALMRLVIPRFRRPLMGAFVWGAIWVGVGFGLWYDRWELIGPIVIIAIGAAILAGRLVPRR
jgi:hypothetical protein